MRGWLGYDAALVARLPARLGADLDLVGAAWLWAALVLAAPLGYAAALLTHSAWLSLAVALGALWMLLQLARLTVAGGGMPLDMPSAEYRPSSTPLLWLALLGVLFALPAQLPLWDHTPLVEAERAALLATHERALGHASDGYARELARCEFVVLRLHALAAEPLQAGRYALGYLALLLGPMLFARAQARAAQRSYDELKVREARRVTTRDALATQRALARLLAPYPTYSGEASPLSKPWRRT